MASPDTCVTASYLKGNSVASPGKELPTDSIRGCGCVENEGGYSTRYSTKGRTGHSGNAKCSSARPCWNGYESVPSNTDCRCFVTNYNLAAVGNTPNQYLVNAEAKASNKFDCCLGNLSGPKYCAPGWCTKSLTKDCDIDFENFCKANPNDGRCKQYCGVVRNGKPRNYSTDHWCANWSRDYCITGDRIVTDTFCTNGSIFYGANKDERAPWSDELASKLCLSRKTNSAYNNFCACINSNIPQAICTDNKCTNASAYKPKEELDRVKSENGCGTICLVIFQENKAGQQIEVSGNTVNMACGTNPETKDEKLITWYQCNKETNQCVLTPVGEKGVYANDVFCGDNCEPADKEAPGATTETYIWTIGGFIFLAIIIIIAIIIIKFAL